VVRPGGTIRLLDYVRPQRPLGRMVTRVWDPWVQWAFGARFDRPTEPLISEAGLVLTSASFVFRDLIRLIEARPAG
jgi:hypothetical protein